MSGGTYEVTNNEAANRFEAHVEGRVAELVYRQDADRLILIHTGVPEELGGRGIGGALVSAARDHAHRNTLTIEARCPFARRWLREHPIEPSDD
ncbi:MAG TPA: GNAT family N-acetyltransferase [Actinomycetota bacterium]|nr:GNAT family N-acetyltransferase [Actinomycetota bacterium]